MSISAILRAEVPVAGDGPADDAVGLERARWLARHVPPSPEA